MDADPAKYVLIPLKQKLIPAFSLFVSGSTYGMDFILGLAPTFGTSRQYIIYIGTPLHNASYVVETMTEQISSGTVTSDTVAMVFPNSTTLQVTSSENSERTKGIRVRATANHCPGVC